MNLRETGEKRLFGGSCVISRTTRGESHVLLIRDEAKNETSAGFYRWFSKQKKVLGFPGGGRGVSMSGKPESLPETLQSELKEEFDLLLPLDLFRDGIHQKYPFLVGQRKQGIINQIGVTSLFVEFDSLGISEQNYTIKKEKAGLARWINLTEVALDFLLLLKQQKQLGELDSRPHMYTTAYLWYLDIVKNWTAEAIKIETDLLNMITKDFLVLESNAGISIRNGVFDDSGKVLSPSNFTAEDRLFLFGS